jgi:hypothetical protein
MNDDDVDLEFIIMEKNSSSYSVERDEYLVTSKS